MSSESTKILNFVSRNEHSVRSNFNLLFAGLFYFSTSLLAFFVEFLLEDGLVYFWVIDDTELFRLKKRLIGDSLFLVGRTALRMLSAYVLTL